MEKKNVNVKMGNTKKRNVKTWVKRRRNHIISGIMFVGGMLLLKTKYQEGYDDALKKDTDKEHNDIYKVK